jgi:hypothetical protein
MLSYVSDPEKPFVEVTVEGHITEDELHEGIRQLRAEVVTGQKSRVLEVIHDFKGMDFAAIWTDLRDGLPLARYVDKVAVVADQRWIQELSGLGCLITKAELKVFDLARLDEARTWIAQ